MFKNFNRLIGFVGAVLAVVIVFFHFHGALASMSGKVAQAWKIFVNGVPPMNRDYDVVTQASDQWRRSEKPVLPDISGFTVENIAMRAPAPREGHVFVRSMKGISGLREFLKEDGRIQRLRLSQTAIEPKAIIIKEGSYDFSHLYEVVQAAAPDQALIRRDGTNIYLLRIPIFVSRHASLTISDRDTAELRLSQDSGAFIANAGDLFILRTKVTGWNEKEDIPAFFENKSVFRPFITTWSGAHLYIAGSTISSLGYHEAKSYGITYSTCRECIAEEENLAPPTGALVGNIFTDMYYGFYSYEAEDVAIVGNIYADNAVYGIDPHDLSRRLIIARNETRNSRKKHGIIISRHVNDSWIFENYSHHNEGSGIMIDRRSVNNIIANNVTAYNKGDGITFFESEDNQTYGNKIYRNGLSGIRIRNSWNIRMMEDQITDNGLVPIVIYSHDLSESQPYRNLREDAYVKKAGAVIVGAAVKLPDRKPVFKIDGIDNLVLSNIHIVSGASAFDDNMLFMEHLVAADMADENKAVLITKKAGIGM